MASEVIAGRYRLERRLGGGGMAEVWAATDVELDRPVAVKLLAPNADPERFGREARAVAALSHPNICTLYAYGETAGRPHMVFEYLPGGSLEERLGRDRPLPDGETARIAAGVAAGLAHAHARGLVHRDLKPSNILFDGDDRPKIADFGIVLTVEGVGLTQAGTVLGTAAYISPEQARGETATAASDVYAFGVILFRMLTGRLPFESEDALAMAAMHRDRPPPPVTAFRRNPPPRLESIAVAALAKSPADRPRDGAALLAELGGPERSGADTALTQVLRRIPVRSRVWPVVFAAAVLAATGITLAVVVTLTGGGSPAEPTTSTTTAPRPAGAPAPPAPATTSTRSTARETAPATEPTPPTATLPATTEPTVMPPPLPSTTTAPATTSTSATTETAATTTTAESATTAAPTTTTVPG